MKIFTKILSKDDLKLKKAFGIIRNDISEVQDNHAKLTVSVNDWVIFLDQENRELKTKVRELEKRLEALEEIPNEKELSLLRSI